MPTRGKKIKLLMIWPLNAKKQFLTFFSAIYAVANVGAGGENLLNRFAKGQYRCKGKETGSGQSVWMYLVVFRGRGDGRNVRAIAGADWIGKIILQAPKYGTMRACWIGGSPLLD